MSRSQVTEEQIREIARRIGEQPGVVQVWLFGSHATGTAGPDSDVDLLAVYEEEPESTTAYAGTSDLPAPAPSALTCWSREVASMHARGRWHAGGLVAHGANHV